MLFSLAFFPNYIGGVDGNSMFAVSTSLAHGGIDVPCSRGIPGEGESCYSNYYPMLSLLAAPGAAVGEVISSVLGSTSTKPAELLVLLVPAAATAGSAVCIRTLSMDHGASSSGGVVAGLVFALGTEAMVYTRTFFAEPLAAFFVALAGVYLLRRDRYWIGAAAVGCLVFTKPQLVFLALPLAMFAAWPRLRVAAATIGCIGIAAACLGIYNMMRFGAFTDFGGDTRDLAGSSSSLDSVASAAGTLLVSPGRGLLIYSSAAVFSIIGLVAARGWRDRLARTSVAAFIGALLIALLNPGVGVNWGTRYLVPVMPLMCVGLAFVPIAWRRAGVGLAALTFVLTSPALLIDFQLAYRASNGDGQSVYWAISDGPIVQLWGALFDTPLSEFQLWWTQPGGLLTVPGALLAAALVASGLAVASRLVLSAPKVEAGGPGG
jgi:hypothetical protein